MRMVVIYESMFGNTRAIATAIAEGLGPSDDVQAVRVVDADAAILEGADLVVVGGPTHARSMSRPGTRKGAPGYVHKPGSDISLEPGADTGPGVREWLDSLDHVHANAAAFDTRVKGPALLTGRASKAIDHRLRNHGVKVVATPESFLVDRKNHLLPGETARARAWGAQLAVVARHDAIGT